MNLIFEHEDKKTHGHIIKEIIIWIVCITLSILAGYLITKYAIEKTTVSGDSMNSTLNDEESILINKLSYKIGEPKRFDVIVFMQEGKEYEYYNIKRIIGLPGEKVTIKDGFVYIDGDKLEEINVVEKINNPGLAKNPITLGEDEYFVLGDNRNQSEDSRFANISMIKKDEIIGKAWIRLSPFGFVSKLNKIEDLDESDETSKENKDTE